MGKKRKETIKKDVPNGSRSEVYGASDIARLKRHIAEYFGEYRIVFSETYSGGLHVDFAVIDPTPGRDFYTMFTIGLGAHKMNSDKPKNKDFERMEIMVCLPPDWDMDSTEERWYWPIRWLKNVAESSAGTDAWFGLGQSMLTAEASEDSPFDGIVMIPPIMFGVDAVLCKLPSRNTVSICQILPIYEEEVDLLLEDSAGTLYEFFDKKRFGILDIYRESLCDWEEDVDDIIPFTVRVEVFWKWFSENEKKLSKIAGSRSEHTFSDLVSAINDGSMIIYKRLFINPIEGHEMSFRTEDSGTMFRILPYLISKMPKEYRGKWKFNPYMSGTGGKPNTVDVEGMEINTEDILVSLSSDPEGSGFILNSYNKDLAEIDPRFMYEIIYGIASTSAGDLLMYICISGINGLKEPEADMFPLTELEARLKESAAENSINLDPFNTLTPYDVEPDDSGDLRFDITKGVTNFPEMVFEYFDDKEFAYSDATKCGVVPAFIFFIAGEKDQDALMEECRTIAAAVEEKALGKRGSGEEIGIILGYAAGNMCGYIDILLFDEGKFISDGAEAALKSFGHAFHISRFSRYDGIRYLCTGEGTDIEHELEVLEKNRSYGLMVDIIEDMGPVDDLDYDLAMRYAEALNGIEMYDKSLPILEKLKDEGRDDIRWNQMIGISLLFCKRYGGASEYLRKCIDLGDETEWTKMLLNMSASLKGQGGNRSGKKK